MLHQAGKPELIKKMNIELIYQTLIALGSATRGEIAEATHMSVTTVRSLLEELVTLGEIVGSDLDVSSGGRRPQRYILSPDRNRILVLYLEEDRIYFRVNKLNGEILEENSVAIMPKSAEADAVRFASKCKELWNISAIGLGVPGVVEKSGFLVDNGWGRWTINDIGKQMQHALNLPMLLENDLNAVALGFCHQYIHQHPQYQMEEMNVAYIYLDRICSGSGIIAGGKIVRGDKGFGGELGYLPMGGGMTLDQAVASVEHSDDKAKYIAQAIAAVNCVVNPSLVVVSGNILKDCRIQLDQIRQHAQQQIPQRMLPDILYPDSFRNDYLTGLSYLTIQMLLPLLPMKKKEPQEED